MKRILLTLLVVTVLGGLATVIVLSLRGEDADKVLTRAELAIRAGKYTDALDLARRHATRFPNDWRGYFVLAKAYNHLGRYDDMRGELEKAAGMQPNNLDVRIALAEAYSIPSAQLVRSRDLPELAALDSAINKLGKANQILGDFHTAHPTDLLEIHVELGMNELYIGQAFRMKARRLEKEAELAQAGGTQGLHDERLKDASDAVARADDNDRKATALLLDVLRDGRKLLVTPLDSPSRRRVRAAFERAGRSAVQLCIQRNDNDGLLRAKEAIVDVEEFAPGAAVVLVLHDLHAAGPIDSAAGAHRLDETARFLDQLIQKVEKDKAAEVTEVKIARSEVALWLADLTTAERMSNELVKSEPTHPRVRLLHTRMLMRRRRWLEAERELFVLSKDFPRWPEAQFAYAEAASKVGREELAREAMIQLTRLDGENLPARRYLANLALRDGYYDRAFEEAHALYRKYPTDASCLRILAEASPHIRQTEQALKALNQAVAEHPAEGDLMMSACEGFALLGDADKAKTAAELAAAVPARGLAERLTTAQALRFLGKIRESEKMLTEDVAAHGDDPRVRYELGRTLWTAKKGLQAIQHYRVALKGDEDNPLYRLALARALFDNGDLEEAQRVIAREKHPTAAANVLKMQIKMVQGEAIDVKEVLTNVGTDTTSGASAAIGYFATGKPDECIKVCNAALKKTPDDPDLRLLLANAYLATGQRKESLAECVELLKAAPEHISNYLRIVTLLADEMSAEQIADRLAKVPGAQADKIDLAVGWLHARRGENAKAADLYRRVLAARGYPADSQKKARVLLARALAMLGKTDEAIDQLDTLMSEPGWTLRVLETKASLLTVAGRPAEAKATLVRLGDLAAEAQDLPLLGRVASLLLRLEAPEDALVTCDTMAKLFPGDAAPDLSRAGVLASLGRNAEAIECYRKAIVKHPGDFGTYELLANALDAQQRAPEALKVLEELESLGQGGRTAALLNRAVLFSRWGLQAQALDCLDELDKLGNGGNPRLRLIMAQALKHLGRIDQARAALKDIPAKAPSYIPAQYILADLAETSDGKLALLQKIDEIEPGRADVLVQRMTILGKAGRPAEAVAAFNAYLKRLGRVEALPRIVALAGLAAMLDAADYDAAKSLTSQIAAKTTVASWRRLAVLMEIDGDPKAAAAGLPPVDKADLFDSLLGLCVSLSAGQTGKAAAWAERIAQVERNLLADSRPMDPTYKTLVLLAAGKTDEARRLLPILQGRNAVGRIVAEQLVGATDGGAASSARLGKLLRASLALELGVTGLARRWAMDLLKAEPACQWAATLAMRAQDDPPAMRQVLETLQPADCPLALRIRGGVLTTDKKIKEAVESYRLASQAEPDNLTTLLDLAMAQHEAGQRAEALELYKRIWKATGSPVAANNAAYLVSCLWPKDPDKLAQGLAWAGAAVQALPGEPSFRDTKGWIAHLMGKKPEACHELRRAVKGLATSADVHYHLSLAEAAAGNRLLADWHLATARSLGMDLAQTGGTQPTGKGPVLARQPGETPAAGAR